MGADRWSARLAGRGVAPNTALPRKIRRNWGSHLASEWSSFANAINIYNIGSNSQSSVRSGLVRCSLFVATWPALTLPASPLHHYCGHWFENNCLKTACSAAIPWYSNFCESSASRQQPLVINLSTILHFNIIIRIFSELWHFYLNPNPQQDNSEKEKNHIECRSSF